MTKKEWEKANEEGTADIEIAIPVSRKEEDEGEFKFYYIPGSKMAKIVHRGPYKGLGQAYNKLFEWIGSNGEQIIGPIREVYPNNPREVPPEQILTEIYAPIE